MLSTGYDLRGILGHDLTYHLIEKTIKSFLNYLKKQKKDQKFLLAVDRNQRNFKIVNFIQDKFNSVFLGLLPTPIFYYEVIQRKKTGIMITASHLPLKYSGLKFILEDGSPWKPNLNNNKTNLELYKKQETRKNIFNPNQSFIVNQKIFSDYFKKLEAIVNRNKLEKKIFVSFDTNNFFLNSSLPFFQKLKIYHSPKAEIKIKSDSDNDRLEIFYKNQLIPNDIVFYFLALANKYQRLGVPVFFSQYLKNKLLKRKKKIFLIQTGHYYFKKAYKNYGLDLAFEPSGHFYFFKDLKTEAPYLAFILFIHNLFKKNNRSLFEKLLTETKLYRFNLFFPNQLREKTINLLKKDLGLKLLKNFDGYFLTGQNFYLHLRKSKTENKLRINFEGDKKYLKIIKNKLKTIV